MYNETGLEGSTGKAEYVIMLKYLGTVKIEQLVKLRGGTVGKRELFLSSQVTSV